MSADVIQQGILLLDTPANEFERYLGSAVGVAVRWRRGRRLGVAGERKKESAVWDRRRPARKGEKSELTRTQQADRQPRH